MKTFFNKYIILLAALIIVACNGKPEKEAPVEESTNESENNVELTSDQYKLTDITLGEVEQKNLSSTIKVNGVLDVPPQSLITISAPMGGFVKNTDLLQGMWVKKGQLIAEIENAEYIQLQQDYLENISKLEYLSSELERQKELSKENINSAKVLEQTISEYKTLKARIAGIEEKLGLIGMDLKQVQKGKISRVAYMHSPIDGYVTTVKVNIGKFVTPTDMMFEIVNTMHLHVELTVFEKDIPKIKEGQKVFFTLADDLSKERIASVYLIGRSIAEDRTVRVHAHMDKEDNKLLPGMYVRAFIETGNHAVNALPDEAIINFAGKNYIFLLKGKKVRNSSEVYEFEMKEVKTGVSENKYTEVTLPDDIEANTDKIVVKGAFALLSKMKNVEEE